MLKRLKLTQKIILLSTVIVVLNLLVLAVIFFVGHKAQDYVVEKSRAEKTISLADSLKSARRDAFRRVAEFSLTRDPESIDSFKESVQSILVLTRKLKDHLSYDRDAYEKLMQVEVKLVALDRVSSRVAQQVLAGDKNRYKIDQYRVIKLTQEIDQSLDAIVSHRSREALLNAASLSSVVDLLNRTILAGVFVNVLVAFIITVSVSRHLQLRVNRLRENAALLIKGEKQHGIISGDDEFCELDRVYHHAQAILDETRRKYQSMIDNASEVVSTIDQGFAFSSVSPVSLKAWGYSPAELSGLRLLKVVHGDDRKSTWMSFEQAKATAEPTTFRSRITTKDGLSKDMSWTVQWNKSESLFACVARDITSQREVERSRDKIVEVIDRDLKEPLASVQNALTQLSQLDCLPLPSRRTLEKARANVNELIFVTGDLVGSQKTEFSLSDLRKAHLNSIDIKPEVSTSLFVSNG